ncbi:MAG: hypothetical protein H3C58_04885 [Fimbriimonadaceae bacterium]|nr:hypothetical protein [Fimbriimonadaceae bacterium]
MLALIAGAILMSSPDQALARASNPMLTRWAKDLDPDIPLPEHPRPNLVRSTPWVSLNGRWDASIVEADGTSAWSGKIVVPFPIQSALSGVTKPLLPSQTLVYKKTLDLSGLPAGHRWALHFGAVDWETTVLVNGREIGRHTGGYDPFTFMLDGVEAKRGVELEVRVKDPVDGPIPRGKQILNPHGIFYTAVSGIWQSVWLEQVPDRHVTGLRLIPSVSGDKASLSVRAYTDKNTAAKDMTIRIKDGERVVAEKSGLDPRAVASLDVPNAKLWSPDSPFLYGVEIIVGSDRITSYAGMRSVGMQRNAEGHVTALTLNGKPLFQLGPLDQGWWPDGLYTAPTDEALAFDIEVTKKMGFNMIRKHVKVEPARWYYHADRLGVLVWQDMPSFFDLVPSGGGDSWTHHYTTWAQQNYFKELRAMVDAFWNHPSIVCWVPFNEGWGQHDTPSVAAWMKAYDPSRLINSVSGWTDEEVGDFHDIHVYPGPAMPPVSDRASILGEYGGLGYAVKGHLWQEDGNWGYRSYADAKSLEEAYADLCERLLILKGRGLAAGVYTQTTDVEIEINGLLTYDRAVEKIPLDRLAAMNRAVIAGSLHLDTLVPVSDTQGLEWSYTTTKPGDDWMQPAFDVSGWSKGPGVLGTRETPGVNVRTIWNTPEIWARRSFEVANLGNRDELRLFVYHDEDAEVYVNGVLAATLPGYVTDYRMIRLNADALAALRPGRNVVAVHCKQTRGGQAVDVGLVRVRK